MSVKRVATSTVINEVSRRCGRITFLEYSEHMRSRVFEGPVEITHMIRKHFILDPTRDYIYIQEHREVLEPLYAFILHDTRATDKNSVINQRDV